jgi:hypothetical protein
LSRSFYCPLTGGTGCRIRGTGKFAKVRGTARAGQEVTVSLQSGKVDFSILSKYVEL